MSRGITTAGKNYLSNTSSARLAHLVRIELPGSTSSAPLYDYLTDFQTPISYGGDVYDSGKLKTVGRVVEEEGIVNYKVNIQVAGEFDEELERAITNPSTESYERKTIRIYRVYLGSDNTIIPMVEEGAGSLIYFEGFITNINVKDNLVSGSSVVTWECASIFQDFEKVTGRLIDDASHRGLDENGNAVVGAAVKPEFSTDTGFQHSNQAVGFAATYNATETTYRISKSGFLGLKSKLKTQEVSVQKQVDIGVDLTAKHIPVVYGVRKVKAEPIFVDVLNKAKGVVCAIYSVCEGPIDSFYNVYINGESAICSDGSLIYNEGRTCYGSQAQGHTLGIFSEDDMGAAFNGAPGEPAGDAVQAILTMLSTTVLGLDRSNGTSLLNDRTFDYEAVYRNLGPIIDPVDPPLPPYWDDEAIDLARKSGTVEYRVYSIPTKDNYYGLFVRHGSTDQRALPIFETIAKDAEAWMDYPPEPWEGFANQRIKGQDESYWDSNSRLRNTAYIAVMFQVNEEENQLPDIEVVVKGIPTKLSSENDTNPEQTTNPVWHLYDYLTSTIYGAGVDKSLLDFDSFASVAAVLDVEDTSYETSWVKYWNYLGWPDASSNSNRAKIQCNAVIDTSRTVLSNIKEMLEQFDGTINFVNGKYRLSVETYEEPTVTIPSADLMGGVTYTDTSNKDKWNSVDAAITDPALGWRSNQINFYSQQYLQQDNNVPKKGKLGYKNITNYYTARTRAKLRLNKSRYSKKYMLDTYYKYSDLTVNDKVYLEYPRLFPNYTPSLRVKKVTHHPDGKISLELEEYGVNMDAFGTQSEVDNTLPEVDTTVDIRPISLQIIDLPNATYDSVVSNTDTTALFVWDVGSTQDLSYFEVQNWDTSSSSISGQATYRIATSQMTNGMYYFPLGNLQEGTSYRFRVRSVDTSGNKSAYISIDYTPTADQTVPLKLPSPTNLAAANSTGSVFTGSNLILSWDFEHQGYTVSFELHILDTDDNIIASIGTSGTNYTFSLTSNIAAYSTNNAGQTGAYRAMKARVRAVYVNDSNKVSDWIYL